MSTMPLSTDHFQVLATLWSKANPGYDVQDVDKIFWESFEKLLELYLMNVDETLESKHNETNNQPQTRRNKMSTTINFSAEYPFENCILKLHEVGGDNYAINVDDLSCPTETLILFERRSAAKLEYIGNAIHFVWRVSWTNADASVEKYQNFNSFDDAAKAFVLLDDTLAEIRDALKVVV